MPAFFSSDMVDHGFSNEENDLDNAVIGYIFVKVL